MKISNVIKVENSKLDISETDSDEVKAKKKKFQSCVTLRNQELLEDIFVDASNTIIDSRPILMNVATIITQEAPQIVDEQTLVSNKVATPYGYVNPLVLDRTVQRIDIPCFDKALSLIYSQTPLNKRHKIRNESGNGFSGSAQLDNQVQLAEDFYNRMNMLRQGLAGYLFERPTSGFNKLDKRIIEGQYACNDHYLDKYTVKAYYRREARGAVKAPICLTASDSFAVDEFTRQYYNLPASVLGKEIAWTPDSMTEWMFRLRAIYAHPLMNHLTSICNSLFAKSSTSQVTSPIVTLPHCDDLNSLIKEANSIDKPHLCWDMSRFGPSMSDQLIDRASLHLARLLSNAKLGDFEYWAAVLLQNTLPEQLIFKDELGKPVTFSNVRAGCLDGIARTSVFNALFHVYFILITLRRIGVKIDDMTSLESLRNEKFFFILVGDGGFLLADQAFLDKFQEAFTDTVTQYSAGSSATWGKNVFCGLRWFDGQGFAFNEWSFTKMLRPERSARDFKFRPNARYGILASIEYFKSIPADRRFLSKTCIDKIVAILNGFYDINFDKFLGNGYDPNVKFDDISNLALLNARDEASVDSDYEATFYTRFSTAEALNICKTSFQRNKQSLGKLTYLSKILEDKQ